ncbi:MAG: hypothetical protein DKM50_05840 [Candidatus Margulisiibacteriota bacterium]|nr:MAG: hypothetical protein A2X43_13050 [Candidatus Margulisbacteria bacterium GWD2_39_127]OGI01102.1 MAG: hypothetical protein A2X42_06780 [Candidatus Margulisbacteria bacterium GWF2_38_17]OGI07337.1 MAG: hypothetical protein A2X41_08580 [Candidatus Margulisbacteria bacterium GWE2_39_32]PZM80069.1 MAG: hypothetical protein DKM50_05840 [Candidatus Margulisiibacteriota bacterium]HAR62860.1 hypothetical protein [Candidatus Margulisiibacteriota bacterium]
MDRHAFIRILHIDKLIRNQSYPNCVFLADKFEVSERTILRDVEALKDSLGAPIKYSRGKNGYYYDSDYQLPQVKFTEGEMISLFISEKILAQYKNTPFYNSLSSVFDKLNLFLPDEVSFDPQMINKSFSFESVKETSIDEDFIEVFNSVISAIKQKQSIQITYHTMSRNKISERIVNPYHVRYAYGAWYLIGYCHTRQSVRTFGIGYIKAMQILEDQFEIQSDFSPEEYFGGSWGIRSGEKEKIILLFSSYISKWIERKLWHPTQQLRKNEDGSVVMSLEISGLDEVIWWIMSFGAEVTVVEPVGLRRRIMKEIEKMKITYNSLS